MLGPRLPFPVFLIAKNFGTNSPPQRSLSMKPLPIVLLFFPLFLVVATGVATAQDQIIVDTEDTTVIRTDNRDGIDVSLPESAENTEIGDTRRDVIEQRESLLNDPEERAEERVDEQQENSINAIERTPALDEDEDAHSRTIPAEADLPGRAPEPEALTPRNFPAPRTNESIEAD